VSSPHGSESVLSPRRRHHRGAGGRGHAGDKDLSAQVLTPTNPPTVQRVRSLSPPWPRPISRSKQTSAGADRTTHTHNGEDANYRPENCTTSRRTAHATVLHPHPEQATSTSLAHEREVKVLHAITRERCALADIEARSRASRPASQACVRVVPMAAHRPTASSRSHMYAVRPPSDSGGGELDKKRLLTRAKSAIRK